jgi:DNA-binding response OmpR family regulator
VLPVSPAARVLVVDDNDLQRDLVAEALSSEGYAVATAADGVDGLAVARASPPDVIVLDLLLPRLDGASMLAELRQDPRLSSTRVLVTTGIQSAHVKRLLSPDATLFKPFGADELLAAVAALIRTRS